MQPKEDIYEHCTGGGPMQRPDVERLMEWGREESVSVFWLAQYVLALEQANRGLREALGDMLTVVRGHDLVNRTGDKHRECCVCGRHTSQLATELRHEPGCKRKAAEDILAALKGGTDGN
jgi:hypothetical protein